MNHTPRRVTTDTCDTCGESWIEHTKAAVVRERTAFYEDRQDFEAVYVTPTSGLDDLVTLLDCIAALKARNRGPVGPVGAMGATGNSAPH